jgi:parallel beta-helix repeat protein
MMLLTNMLSSIFVIQPVKAAGGTIYIRSDGSVDPPTAPIQRDGDVYAFTDNINDSIVVERSNIIIDGAGYKLQGDGTGYGFYLGTINNVTIKNCNISKFIVGIHLYYSNDTVILNNNINSNDCISLTASSNNRLVKNILLSNGTGIRLYHGGTWPGRPSPANNTIIKNTIASIQPHYGHGIFVHDDWWVLTSTTISNNNLSDYEYGIYFGTSSANVITSNNLLNNILGIMLYGSTDNIITSNNISNNSVGIYLVRYASGNKIYHNNLIKNTKQGYNYDININLWDDGYSSGGNYWSDYTDVDLYSGPYQNETGSDAIWDHPYVIDADNQDRYPLVNPWSPTSPWPMFLHDPQHTGRSPFVGPRISPEAQVLVEGERDDDYLFLPTVIGSDGTLYFGARITEGGVTNEGLYAFNSDGTENWFYGQSNPRGAPALFEGESIVYILSYGVEFGGISAVNAKTGNLEWRKSFASLYGDQNPVIGDNGILYFIAGYILPDESYDSCLFALDKNGEAVWVYAINRGETYFDLQLPDEGSAGGAFPGPASALTIDKQGTIYFGYNKTLFALNPNGTEKWRKAFNVTRVLHPNIGTPSIGADGTVYVPVERTREDPRGRGNTGSFYAVNPDGTVKWEAGVGYGIGIPLIGPDGNVYIDYITYPVDSPVHHVMALDPAGFANWHLSSYDSMIPRAVDAEGTIYITEENVLRAVNPDGSEKWRWVASDDLGWLSIGINGALYIPSRGKLYAIRDLLPPDFSIAASPTSLTVQQGSSGTSVITIASINGFNQAVQLTVSGAPSGVTTTLSPEQVTPPPDGSTTSTLSVSVDTTATLGSYTLTVTGTNGTLTHSVDISLEITTLGIFEPKLSIPIYAPTYQQAHPGTILTFIINVTNHGNVTDTIELSASDTLAWTIQLSESSVTLEPNQSTDVYLNLTAGDYDRTDIITVTGKSQGDASKTSSCQVKAITFGEGTGLFNVWLKFSNKDTQQHTLIFHAPGYHYTVPLPPYVKLSSETITLDPSQEAELYVFFDPGSAESGLNSISIGVTDIPSGDSASIPIKFDEYLITATDFDLTEDSYNFSNGVYDTNTCYGMAATSILYFKNPLLLYQKYSKLTTYSLTEEEARDEILRYQGDVINNKLALTLALPGSPNEEAEYKKLKENIQKNNPMVLALQFKEKLFGKEWHAVVAYKIVEEGNKAYILIYDNELPYSDMSDMTAFRYATFDLATHDLYYYGTKCEFLVYEPKEDIISQPFPKVTSWIGQVYSRIKSGLNLIFDCPVNITIIDQYGRVISDNGTNQIPNATVASTNETKYFCLPLDLTYNVIISAYDVGNFSLMIVRPIADSNASIDMYENVSVKFGTQATLEIIPYQMNQTMKIDNEGDGVVDELKSPSVSEIIYIPLPSYTLTVNSSPTGVTFTIDGVPHTAPWSGTFSEGVSSSLVMPETYDGHIWSHWLEDGDTNRSKTVLIGTNVTLTAIYTLLQPPLSASISPLSASILVGQSVTFTSTVSGGSTPYSYQWYLNAAPVSGATSDTWTFTPTAGGIYYIHLKVTDAKGNTTQSETARITVFPVPVGGYSVPINISTTAKPITTYIALVAVLIVGFAITRRKISRKPK